MERGSDILQKPVILVVDDEQPIARLLRLELGSQGFCVIAAMSGREALQMVEEQRPDLVLLDIVMPEMSGLEVLARLKAEYKMPVVILSAKSSEDTRVRAFEMGADDFIIKPFSPENVTATVQFLLAGGEGRGRPSRIVRAGDLEIDLLSERVTRNEQLVPLSRSEWLLLRELARHEGRPRLYQELLSAVWGGEYRDDLDYLRLWVRRLQEKLGNGPAGPQTIRDYYGIGYRLNISPEQAPG